MASVTTTTVAPPVFQGRLDLGEVNSMLNGHRDYLKGTLVEGDTRTRDRVNRAHTYSSDTPGSSSHFTDSPTTLEASVADENLASDARPQARTWKTEHHRVSMGPEKAWSIGSGELDSAADGGQVEKSITEVLAGVEPNARSRKASHSLRFFKEGLPEEKGKRKDTRPLTHKPSALGEKTATEAEGDVGGPHIPEDGPPSASRPSRTRTIPRTPEVVETIKESPEDYFLCKQNHLAIQFTSPIKPAASPHKLVHQDRQQVSDPDEPNLEHRRKSDASGGAGDSAIEEGEESGEEKIQSAVFLPHQAPEQPQEHVPAPRVAPPRTLSRHDDFHPWLVRTDEPEVDQSGVGADVEKKQLRSEPVGSSSVAPELDTQPDGPTAADESGLPSSRPSRPVSQYIEENVHDHRGEPKQPLEAIELIPYKHQVGGHTTLWRFSRRAVCKQLNNRENEFYEKIEQYHQDLLAFLPRYIGVLNVTFQKLPRRKSTMRKDDAPASDRDHMGSNGTAQKHFELESSNDRPRIISQSLQNDSRQIPTVTFVDNQHILPRNLLQPVPSMPILSRYRSASASADGPAPEEYQGPVTPPRHVLARPTLHDRHANSWGATTVNKKLRNEVFNDAFLKQPIAIHRHRKGHRRPLPRRTLQQTLRPTGSDPSLTESREKKAQVAEEAKLLAKTNGSSCLTQSQSDIGQVADFCEDDEPPPKDVTGTSAPEPEILGDSSPAALTKKRRYSGTGLRRKPDDVRDDRGSLKYFEEADEVGYKGNRGEILPKTPQKPQSLLSQSALEMVNSQNDAALSTMTSAETSEVPSPTAEFKKIPRPVNPKEAQTQSDSRVEYFLLLEDLTAGMKRPCIMDLKMGTRQYGVDANPKKQKSQQGKCAKTTSRELGVRVCGLQVWDVKTQGYVFKDKYYGREIKKGQEFQDALSRFLYDGVDPASILRHIPTVLRKLDELEVIVGRLDGYRFYAASLLMFYDGDTSSDNIDQAAIEDSTTDFATDTEDAPRRTRKNKRDIDFKIADFANCITPYDSMEDKACPPRHPGEPDRGFMRGLRSLRKYFLKIQRDTRADMGLVLRGVQHQELFVGSDDEGEVSE